MCPSYTKRKPSSSLHDSGLLETRVLRTPAALAGEEVVIVMNNSHNRSLSLLRALRSLKGWSQDDLALRLGCSQTRISRIEKGQVVPPRQDAVRLAKILGTEAKTLFPPK